MLTVAQTFLDITWRDVTGDLHPGLSVHAPRVAVHRCVTVTGESTASVAELWIATRGTAERPYYMRAVESPENGTGEWEARFILGSAVGSATYELYVLRVSNDTSAFVDSVRRQKAKRPRSPKGFLCRAGGRPGGADTFGRERWGFDGRIGVCVRGGDQPLAHAFALSTSFELDGR
ncbi:hypothetical protein [Streptomonospora arabica]|uniref:Uncharacterized protein n=1 Tax=Streptomonospora arabica TaxID=412417 RepID=A0ABV9SK64_9ACTN